MFAGTTATSYAFSPSRRRPSQSARRAMNACLIMMQQFWVCRTRHSNISVHNSVRQTLIKGFISTNDLDPPTLPPARQSVRCRQTGSRRGIQKLRSKEIGDLHERWIVDK